MMRPAPEPADRRSSSVIDKTWESPAAAVADIPDGATVKGDAISAVKADEATPQVQIESS